MPQQVPSAADAEPNPEVLARLQAAGPEALDDLEALQPAGGLSPAQAAALLDAFGSLPEVLAASRPALERVVSPRQAAQLALARELALRILRRPLRTRPVLGGWTAVAAYLQAALAGRGREQFRVLFLDHRNRLIRDEVMGEGTVDAAPVYPREVLRRALELDAAALVLAHNHPGGDPAPSGADIESTRQVVEAGRALRIAVHDHFLVADQTVVSFKTLGLL